MIDALILKYGLEDLNPGDMIELAAALMAQAMTDIKEIESAIIKEILDERQEEGEGED